VQAIELDPEFCKNIGQIVLLGGAFSVNGNVNPAAEAHVSCTNPCSQSAVAVVFAF
jgi:inosine-uridine nucleoside N-ribohydrolase